MGTKNPRRFPAGGFCRHTATRSGIEVPMHAEADRPVVDVGCGKLSDTRVGARKIGATIDACGLQLGVQHVETHVEVLGDVPLGARANPPGLPVLIAANRSNSEVARTRAVRRSEE